MIDNTLPKLIVYLGHKNVIKTFKDFEESNAPCNTCLVQPTCVNIVDGSRITLTPCDKIIKYLNKLGMLLLSYSHSSG